MIIFGKNKKLKPMKKLLLLLLCVPLIGIGQTEYKKTYYENGKTETEGNYIDGRKEGLWKWYYESGELESTGIYKNGQSHGIFHGWYKNGQLRCEGYFKYDKLDNYFKYIQENGRLSFFRKYKDGKIISETRWDKNGKEYSD